MFTRAAGVCLLVPSTGAIFLVRRSARVTSPLTWSVPGGYVEPGESDLEGAAREAREEVGPLPPGELAGVHVRRAPGITYSCYFLTATPNAVRRWKPRLNWESDRAGWFSVDDPPEPLHEGMEEVLAVASRLTPLARR